VVSVPFAGTFDGGGNIIRGVAIAYTQPDNATAPSYVGLFSQITVSGTVARVTLEFVEALIVPTITGNASSVASSPVFVGAIAGQNAGTVSDIAVVSSLLDTDGVTAIVPVGGTGANAGGVVGENTGTGSLVRIIYLAPSPSDTANIYPIVFSQTSGTGTVNNSNLFYLGGADDAAIVSTGGVSVINPVEGFDYALPDNGVGTMRNTDQLASTVSGSPGGWTNPTPPPPSIWTLLNGTLTYTDYPGTYQFIIRDTSTLASVSAPQSYPSAWPVVSVNAPGAALMALMMEEELIDDDLYLDVDITADGDNDGSGDVNLSDNDTVSENTADNEIAGGDDDSVADNVVNDGATNEDEAANNGAGESGIDSNTDSSNSGTDSSDDDSANAAGEPDFSSDSGDDVVLVAGALTLFGGFGFTRTKVFRSFMRKRNAIAVRKINNYNEQKYKGRRVIR
jgi:hypothetical protein